MNVKIQHKNLDLLRNHQKLIDRQSQKIRKMLQTFSSDVVGLTINIVKLPRGNQYQTGLVLNLPQRTIRVEELEDNATSSIVRAFSELRRRVKRFKSQLSRERLWRREPLRTWTEVPGPTTRELQDNIRDNLEKIENYVRRELYHNVIVGTMPPGVVEPQAIVDDVFVEVTSNLPDKPEDLSVEQWMFRLAGRILKERMQRLEDHREEASIEETASPEDRWEDEQLNFYQPDELLHLEDLVSDRSSANPEEIFEREEVAERLQQNVAHLPDSIRESFVLFAMEGFTSDEVAMITGKKSEQVLTEVEKAREYLSEGFSF
jgi:RNA polymerase sigma factor (sigma-70 family)